MIDTHSHIDFDDYQENFEDFLSDIQNNGIEKVIIPGVEPSSFNKIISLCNKYDMIYAALGVHPSEFETYNNQTEEIIYKLSKQQKIIAIGEIGLDYHYGFETKEEQKNIFRRQLKIAEKIELPVIIHDREAHEDTLNILEDYKLKDIIFHCFSGDVNFAEKCISKGYYIGIGGVVTFKNAKDLKESTKIIPLNKILLETDAPYLAPVPYRGKINTPSYLKYIAQEIATIKNIDIEKVKQQTTVNAKRIFNF